METINIPIDLYQINTKNFNWKSDFAFENLCKEYLEKKINFWDSSFVLSKDKWYKAVEAKPIQCNDDSKYYSFQSKYVKWSPTNQLLNSFFEWIKSIKKLQEAITGWTVKSRIKEEDLAILDVLYVFSTWDLDDNSKKKITTWLQMAKSSLEVIFLLKEEFAEKLKEKEMIDIREFYYPNKNVREREHKENQRKVTPLSKEDISKKWYTMGDYQKWLHWVWESDLKKAENVYESYFLNKHMYITTNSFEKFTDIEKDIADKKFKTIECHSQSNDKNFCNLLEYGRNEIEKLSPDNIHIKCLLEWDQEKEWVFMEHSAQGIAEFKFEKNKVLFVNKNINGTTWSE